MLYVSIDFSLKKIEDTQSIVNESKFFVSFIHDLQGWSYLEEGRERGGESWGKVARLDNTWKCSTSWNRPSQILFSLLV